MKEKDTGASLAPRKERLVYEIKIAASPEAVWKSLREATKLAR